MDLIPSFNKLLHNSMAPILLIPIPLCKRFLHLAGKKVILRLGEMRTWPVKVELCGNNLDLVKFSDGWIKFVEDNPIEDHFSVLFVNHEPLIFDVVIYDKAGVAMSKCLCGYNKKELNDTSVVLTITNTAIKRGQLTIPKTFWDDEVVVRGKFRAESALFTVPGNKIFDIKIYHHPDGRHIFNGFDEIIQYLNLTLGSTINCNLQDAPGLHFVLAN